MPRGVWYSLVLSSIDGGMIGLCFWVFAGLLITSLCVVEMDSDTKKSFDGRYVRPYTILSSAASSIIDTLQSCCAQ
jgi:hypothetical protein